MTIMYTRDMKKSEKAKKTTYIIMLALLVFSLVGCAGTEEEADDTLYFHHSLAERQSQNTEQSPREADKKMETLGAFMITEMNAKKEFLILYSYATGLEYRYHYGMTTHFYDKYGGRTTVSSFEPGLMVIIGQVTPEGILSSVQASADVWEYDDVSRFSIDPSLKMFKIADRKFHYDDSVHVFSRKEKAAMEDIAQGDVLSVIGVDKQILSVRITTAQGTLKLKNTKLFEGSFLQLGDKIFTEITSDLTLKVPEGKYTLTVANNGWGGSKDVKIKRGKTTRVDLDELKGSGPNYGKVRFLIDEDDAVLMIDGEEKPVGEVLKLSYGRHRVAVYASGYDVWKRNLYVNSRETTLVVSLKDEEEQKEQEQQTAAAQAEKKENSQTAENSQSDSNSQKKETEKASESEKRKEELDTVKDLITGLTDSSSLVSK